MTRHTPEPTALEVQTAWALAQWHATGHLPSTAQMRNQFETGPMRRGLTCAAAFITARAMGHTVTLAELDNPERALRDEMDRQARERGLTKRPRIPFRIA